MFIGDNRNGLKEVKPDQRRLAPVAVINSAFNNRLVSWRLIHVVVSGAKLLFVHLKTCVWGGGGVERRNG